MKTASAVLSLLLASQSFAQVAAVRVVPISPSLPGMLAAPAALGSSVVPLSAPSLTASPMAVSLPVTAAPAVAVPLAAPALPVARAAAAVPANPNGGRPSSESQRDQAARPFDGAAARPASSDDAVPAQPSSEESPRLNLPAKTFVLPNGLTVVVHTDKTSPVVAVSITYKVGSQHEREGLSGFAHLFEHLMAQGTKSLKPREISQLIESNGGVRNAYTMRTNTTYHSVVPKSALKTVLWAEAERMSTLNVDARALALEQQVVLEEMRLRYTNAAYAKARDAGMAETAFSKWENRHTTIGEDADVRNARLEDVRAFYQAHYAPNNAVIALAGDVTEAEARELVGRFFGPLTPRTIAAKPDLSEAPIEGEKRRVVEDKFAKVPLVMTGWRAPERGTKDYWALTVLAEVLGSGEESPLYQALVKETKLALSVQPNYPWWTSQTNPGGPDLFGLMMSLKPGSSVDAALAVADRVIARIAQHGPDAAQVAAAKTGLELSWTKDLEQLIDRAKTLSSYAALVGNPAGLSRDLEALLSVTPADVRDAAARWLTGRGRAVVEARPAPQLALAADQPTAPIPAETPRPAGDPKPELDAQPSAPLPAIERFALSNGLKVVVVQDKRLPLLEARLNIPGGRVAERAGEEGLSAAVSELLTSGAGDLDAKGVSARFSALGYKLDVSRGMESYSLDAAGLARNSGAFFAAVADVLRRASFPQDEVALWKENKAEELKISRSKPDFLSNEKVKAEVFGPAHPYGRPALEDSQLAAVDRAKIIAYARRALSPDGATLVVTGDIQPEALRAQLESAFAGWNAPSSAAVVPALAATSPAPLSLVNRDGSKQANLTIAQAIDLKPGDPDWLAFSVMNQILGGSATSRLFLNLRVDKGYTYGSYARAAALGRGSLWTATAETRNEVAAPALAEMRKEIARMRDEDVPEATLAAVKRYLAGIFLLKNSSIDYQADSLAAYERDGRNAESELSTYLARLNALTPADIRRVAQKYLDPAKMATVVVGDEKVLGPALAR
ncbi:MAG: insulinase family protein [Elusimicrobia bacterium]|nr:insulinase family protein [Elusimicrobiota bacterium]